MGRVSRQMATAFERQHDRFQERQLIFFFFLFHFKRSAYDGDNKYDGASFFLASLIRFFSYLPFLLFKKGNLYALGLYHISMDSFSFIIWMALLGLIETQFNTKSLQMEVATQFIIIIFFTFNSLHHVSTPECPTFGVNISQKRDKCVCIHYTSSSSAHCASRQQFMVMG